MLVGLAFSLVVGEGGGGGREGEDEDALYRI